MPERHDHGAGQGRELDHGLRLVLLLRVPHGVAQDQPAFGVGVDHLDGLARHAPHDISRPLRIAVRHVLDQRADPDHVGPRLAPGDQPHRPRHRPRATHVPFHFFHSAGGF